MAQSEITASLVERGAEKLAAAKLAALAYGRPGIAINYFSDPESLQAYQEKIKEFFKKFPGSIKEPNYGEYPHLITKALELPSGTTLEQVCSELESSGFKKLTNVYPALGTINQTGMNYEKDDVRAVVSSTRNRVGLIFYQDKPKK